MMLLNIHFRFINLTDTNMNFLRYDVNKVMMLVMFLTKYILMTLFAIMLHISTKDPSLHDDLFRKPFINCSDTAPNGLSISMRESPNSIRTIYGLK